MTTRQKVESLLPDLVTQKNWAKIAELTEQYELEANATDTSAPQPFYGAQLAVYIIMNDLNNARFLWKRIHPDIKKGNPELAAIWRIGQNLWTRNYDQVYASLTGYNWSAAITPFIAAAGEAIRQRMFRLLSRSYSAISADDAASFLGLTAAETIRIATSPENGWTYDAASNMLRPKVKEEPKQQTTTVEQMKQLTEYVIHLETA